ncbi:hypothetical protein JL722_2456 [Aureococcus anophagefferens]|nr:hypothetical protein JL722_2456 [Aureococcus anophagefferens]
MARPRVVVAAAATLGVAGAHNFILHEAPLSWPDAAVACRAAGGRLAKVEDAAEQAVLATTMGSQAVWIGGSDGATEGAFENWLTPDRAAAFPGCGGHAGESEPNDWGAGEDCMGAYEHCGLWFDANCADPRPYVCEHPEAAARAACPEGWRGDPDADDGWSGDGAAGWDAGCAAPDRYGYDGWAAGEPNQFLGLEEDCAAFGVWGSMRWYDAPCGQSFRCLCEVELAGAAAGAAGAAAAPTAAPTPRAVEAAPDASCPLAFVPAAGTWADAEATCVSLGGHLATLPDAAASAYASAHFVRARGGCRPAWIGYNDREEEGVWAWADGSVGGYERWWPGEPDDSANGARGADCASMGVDCVHGWRGVADEWVDSGCDAAGADYTPRGALCQLRALAAGDCAGAGGAGGGVCAANPCPADVCAGTFTCDDAARFGYTATACGEYGSGGVDDDCAAPDDAFCAEGYGGASAAAGSDGRVSTCCIPAAPAPGVDADACPLALNAAPLSWRSAEALRRPRRHATAALERVAGGAGLGRPARARALERGRSPMARWATAAAATPGCGAWAGADEPDEGAAACMAVHGGCGLWFDHPCDGKKAYVCEYADDAGGGEKGPEAAAGGGMMAVVVAVVLVLALLGGGAAAYAAKRRRGHAARGYGDVARGYEPDSDLPSYGDYVLNPISVSAGV